MLWTCLHRKTPMKLQQLPLNEPPILQALSLVWYLGRCHGQPYLVALKAIQLILHTSAIYICCARRNAEMSITPPTTTEPFSTLVVLRNEPVATRFVSHLFLECVLRGYDYGAVKRLVCSMFYCANQIHLLCALFFDARRGGSEITPVERSR